MSQPVVSVIVPARNEEACLSLCLESLVTQAGIEFEVIVVDDASTDRTAEIARSFADASDGGSSTPDGFTHGKGTTYSRANTDDVRTSQGGDSLANHPPAPEPRRTVLGTAESRALPGRADLSDVSADCERVVVIPAGPLPAGWTGKNNAMTAGAKIARGKWLLFTDADTFHKPGSLARAVAEAEEHGASLLSYSPEQEACTFWEKAVMPVIFAELAATYPPKKVNDPASPIAAANGQYLMISREAYDAVGGHTKIASDLLEDVAIARLVKTSGRRIFFRYGGDAVRTRMYRSWPQMKEGWTKNLGLLFAYPQRLALYRIAEFVLVAVILIAGIVALLLSRIDVAAMNFGAALLIAAFSLRRIQRAHFSIGSNLLALGGLPIFSYLLLRSARLHANGSVSWKGRTYANSGNEVSAA